MSGRYLFKAKHFKEWHIGNIVKEPDGLYIRDINENVMAYINDESTICQCTGLKDKNGKKIWENDIVKTVSDIYAPVKFGLYTTGFAIEECNQGFYVDFPDETYLRHELGYWHNKVEVRGNIFDNPDLLQEESDE
jgi:uncharacterized phage protein (TIGR01671 family)